MEAREGHASVYKSGRTGFESIVNSQWIFAKDYAKKTSWD